MLPFLNMSKPEQDFLCIMDPIAQKQVWKPSEDHEIPLRPGIMRLLISPSAFRPHAVLFAGPSHLSFIPQTHCVERWLTAPYQVCLNASKQTLALTG